MKSAKSATMKLAMNPEKSAVLLAATFLAAIGFSGTSSAQTPVESNAPIRPSIYGTNTSAPGKKAAPIQAPAGDSYNLNAPAQNAGTAQAPVEADPSLAKKPGAKTRAAIPSTPMSAFSGYNIKHTRPQNSVNNPRGGSRETNDEFEGVQGSPNSSTEAAAEEGNQGVGTAKKNSRSRSTAKSNKIQRLPRAKDNGSPLIDRASRELVIRPEDETPTIVTGGAATVTSTVEKVEAPTTRPSFEIEIAVQPYEPQGQVQIQGTDPVGFGSPGTRPMPSLELRWLPLRFDALPQFEFGAFASAGYVSHALAVSAPTGVSIEDSQLNTTKAQAGLVGSWQKAPLTKWAIRGELGLGRLIATQVSQTSFADNSASLAYASAGAYFDYDIFDKFSVSVGYERHEPTGGETPVLIVPRNNFLLGLSGGFQ